MPSAGASRSQLQCNGSWGAKASSVLAWSGLWSSSRLISDINVQVKVNKFNTSESQSHLPHNLKLLDPRLAEQHELYLLALPYACPLFLVTVFSMLCLLHPRTFLLYLMSMPPKQRVCSATPRQRRLWTVSLCLKLLLNSLFADKIASRQGVRRLSNHLSVHLVLLISSDINTGVPSTCIVLHSTVYDLLH